MNPYVVYGSFMEILATCYCWAETKEAAIEKYKKAFIASERNGLEIDVYEIKDSEKESIEKCDEGYVSYCGMYEYDSLY